MVFRILVNLSPPGYSKHHGPWNLFHENLAIIRDRNLISEVTVLQYYSSVTTCIPYQLFLHSKMTWVWQVDKNHERALSLAHRHSSLAHRHSSLAHRHSYQMESRINVNAHPTPASGYTQKVAVAWGKNPPLSIIFNTIHVCACARHMQKKRPS